MKYGLSVIAIVLLLTMAVPVWAAQEAEPVMAEASAPVAQETTAATADQWLEARSAVTLDSLFLIGGGPCNQAVCSPGEFCCNYSCSTCTPLGSYCTQQICPPVS